MKRDDDYIRNVLIEVESQDSHYLDDSHNSSFFKSFDDSRDEKKGIFDMSEKPLEEQKRDHHLELMCEYGLLKKRGIWEYRMTAKGHDFLDAIRDDDTWSEIKGKISENGSNASHETIRLLAIGLQRKSFSDHIEINS